MRSENNVKIRVKTQQTFTEKSSEVELSSFDPGEKNRTLKSNNHANVTHDIIHECNYYRLTYGIERSCAYELLRIFLKYIVLIFFK